MNCFIGKVYDEVNHNHVCQTRPRSHFLGGTFVAGHIASESVDPAVSAFGRFLVASLYLVVVFSIRERTWLIPSRRQLLFIIAAGMTGVIAYNIFFFNSLRFIEANLASLIIALNPVVIMSTAAVLGMDRLTGQRVLGLLLALVGVGIVLTHGDLSALTGSIGPGEILIFGCVACWSTYTLIGRSLGLRLKVKGATSKLSKASGLSTRPAFI